MRKQLQGTRVAEGAGALYEEILFLNLRVWQYNLYSGRQDTYHVDASCSNLAVTLADGLMQDIRHYSGARPLNMLISLLPG